MTSQPVPRPDPGEGRSGRSPGRRYGLLPGRRSKPLPERGAQSLPGRRSGTLPVRSGGAAAPVHDPAALGFVDRPGREYWWGLLGEGVRDRMAARVGPAVEWWAYCRTTDGERPYAVVLGERGLAVSTPTVNDRGGPAQLLTVVPFVPASLRHAVVVQRPTRRPPSGAAATDDPAPGTGGAEPPLTARLRGFLGNLPAEAQSRLQWPFVNGDVFDSGDHFYSGDEDELDVWCYLAGRRWVTFVSGHGSGLSGPAHRASWRLVCRQAEVAVR
ncbi:hypothetical protein [Streptomyces sp. enrichment culture]|uniref:hypothetical protein n=1 Tax=Streptomyces sp. enrichment culture TaxID=1795815 RepID=UPI003F56B3A8